MDLKRGGLSARKAWACVGDVVVCLGAGITCDSPREVFTTVNQCLHNGEVARAAASDGSTLYWHDGIGYVIAPAQQVAQFAADRTGKWGDIAVSHLPPETRDVFTLGISHGAAPKNAAYQYAVLPNISREDFAVRAGKLNITALRNDSAAQAVRIGGDLLVAFWDAGEILDGESRISVDQPCLLLLRRRPRAPGGGEVYAVSVSNPRSAALAVTVNLRSNTTVQQVRFDLPAGPLAGSTVTALAGK
jgi:chondroitin AC lyase